MLRFHIVVLFRTMVNIQSIIGCMLLFRFHTLSINRKFDPFIRYLTPSENPLKIKSPYRSRRQDTSQIFKKKIHQCNLLPILLYSFLFIMVFILMIFFMTVFNEIMCSIRQIIKEKCIIHIHIHKWIWSLSLVILHYHYPYVISTFFSKLSA